MGVDDDGRSESTELPGPQFLERLAVVQHLLDHEDRALLGVMFGFQQGCLLAQVEAGTDEVLVSFHDSLADATSAIRAEDVENLDVSHRGPYEQALGCDSFWRWVLTNQQGYQDAFQIELANGNQQHELTLQYLAIAGRLKLLLVTSAAS